MKAFGFAAGILDPDKIENGAFCHFTSPDSGDKLYLPGAVRENGTVDESKAIGAYVRSVNSNIYDAFLDQVTRTSMTKNRRAKSEEQKQQVIFEQLKTERPKNFAVLVTRFLNTDPTTPGEFAPSQEEKEAVAKDPHHSPYVTQVLTFAQDDSNYGFTQPKPPVDDGAVDVAPQGNADAA